MSANGGSSTYRNIPDVAMAADQIYVIGHESGVSLGFEVGGTSAAAMIHFSLKQVLNSLKPADPVVLQVQRDNKLRYVTLSLGIMPEPEPRL